MNTTGNLTGYKADHHYEKKHPESNYCINDHTSLLSFL